MRQYQALLILKANLDEEGVNACKAKLEKALASNDGKIINFENLGKRDLATHFDENNQGIFIRLTYESGPKAPGELAVVTRNNEEFIRHLSVKADSVAEPQA